jgi:hypothetical protein
MKVESGMKAWIVLTLLLMLPEVGGARIATAWTYQAMYDEADLVVIARPVSVSQSDEMVALPNFNPKTNVYELQTTFSVDVALKGTSTESLQLRHFKLADQHQFALAGPSFVQFDPANRHSYLMFLKSDQRGSYFPVTGQPDTAVAIIELESGAQ